MVVGYSWARPSASWANAKYLVKELVSYIRFHNIRTTATLISNVNILFAPPLLAQRYLPVQLFYQISIAKFNSHNNISKNENKSAPSSARLLDFLSGHRSRTYKFPSLTPLTFMAWVFVLWNSIWAYVWGRSAPSFTSWRVASKSPSFVWHVFHEMLYSLV